jgi:proteasome lid subunit RPN8/RPN11
MRCAELRLVASAAVAAGGAAGHDAVARADGSCPPIVFGAPYGSLDELAVETLAKLFDEGTSYESGGFFVEEGGAYYASQPVTQGGRRAVDYCIVLPRGARLAGIYHTHVTSSALSARDRSNAERAAVPSYIGTLRDRSLLVYDGRRRELLALERAPRTTTATTRADGKVASTDKDTGRAPSFVHRLAEAKRRALAWLDEVLQRF